ncbi:hypothetical protein C0Q70_11372 [Pomacea canaliculata]|uniref:Ion transport domain-containing protein n=1 Tax=Pomacea canaliculata TaxID=400727 RepID=A0A2T7P5T0_POMCA|nr:two pore calcium channel protein 2-like isoform X2 [Pomacea canaliculata]PVD28777.1 hypothetical protein C0Q70_11372 [Pomacea canaliculata]
MTTYRDISPLIGAVNPRETLQTQELDVRILAASDGAQYDDSNIQPVSIPESHVQLDVCFDDDDECLNPDPEVRDRHDSWELTSTDSIGHGDNALQSLEEYQQFAGLQETSLIQAVVFLEDAFKYRSINHKVDEICLRLYRQYHSTAVQVFRVAVIFTLHILAFFEYPSSLSLSSDVRLRQERVDVPCWLTSTIELLCLLLLLADNVTRFFLLGRRNFFKLKWDMASIIIVVISIIDWMVSVGMGCAEPVRFRRILRPFFILQNSSLMKKIVNCLRMTMPEVFSVLIMLAMHLYIFTLLGMLLFPTPPQRPQSANSTNTVPDNATMGVISDNRNEGRKYFGTLLDSFMSLLVLLTTANNPDVTMPAYSHNRLSSLFFIVFLIIGLYCFMNMLTAVIYNQFRGYFLNSMQSSLNRRRLGVRAAFEVLRRKRGNLHPDNRIEVRTEVGKQVVKAVVEKIFVPVYIRHALLEELDKYPESSFCAKDFQQLFTLLDMEKKPAREVEVRWFVNPLLWRLQRIFVHRMFAYFGIFVAFLNVIVISVELATQYDQSFYDSHSDLRAFNFSFAIYYLVEQVLKIWAMGWRRYVFDKGNVFDGVITLALVGGEMFSAITFGVPFFEKHEVSSINTLWNVLRIINILIMVRLLRIIPHLKSMRIISSVLLDLVRNMKSFAGVLIVIYYAFAILGMEIFSDKITVDKITNTSNVTYACGTYRQLMYWANNFDDFAAAIVVLWHIMVVNNWNVFLEAFGEATSPWSYLFFVAWWLISVIIVLNLFTALIMENFIMKWDRSQQIRNTNGDFDQPMVLNSVHDMFRGLLEEPAENDLLRQLSDHQYLVLER